MPSCRRTRSRKLKASMASIWRSDPRPFESYQLTNNNAEIRRVKARIEQLSKQAQQGFFRLGVRRGPCGNEPGGRTACRCSLTGKPDADTRAELKSNGFPPGSQRGGGEGKGSSRTMPSGRLTVWNVSSRCPAKSPPSFKRSPLSCRPCGNRAKKSRRSRKRKLRPAGMPSEASLGPHRPEVFCSPKIVRGASRIAGSPDGKEVLCRKK